jgi:Holliday junction resolvase-like predicted endonuclease
MERTNGATGSVTRTKAEEYRRLAQECLAMARTVSTEEARADLMTMAQVWHRLANEQDQRSDLAETPAPPPATEQIQPVVQQQQQVQPKDDAKKE